MKFIDFFSGIGGMRLGLEKAGHICMGFCEWDKYARKTYKAIHNTEGEWEAHDIREVKPYDVSTVPLWSFGFPCQDISIAGKQLGIRGGRSGLFWEIVRLLEGRKIEDRPEWLLVENVRNLLSVGRGFDFARLLCTLGSIGYYCEWDLLNSKNYNGVQNRERVFIVAHLGKSCKRKIFPIRYESDGMLKQITNIMPGRNRTNPNQGRVYEKSGLAPTLGCSQGGNRQPFVIVNGKIRKLTPKEYWRAFNFPDECFEKAKETGMSCTQLYKQAGNAVDVNVSAVIGNVLKEIENENLHL